MDLLYTYMYSYKKLCWLYYRFGRQIGLISAAVPQVIIGVLVTFSHNYVVFLLLYFLQGTTQVGIMLSSCVWGLNVILHDMNVSSSQQS